MTLTATERDLVDAASRWFDAHRAQFVDELCELLRYPSVSDESDPNPRPGAPYGPEVRRVFDHMLAKAGRDGLPTRDYTGHVMEVVYPQENVETDRDIAFVDHLDVVPADDGWTHDAFDPQVIGDIVIGRGSLDNKGVALTSYFLPVSSRNTTTVSATAYVYCSAAPKRSRSTTSNGSSPTSARRTRPSSPMVPSR